MIFALTGKNTHALSEHLKQVVAAFVNEHGDMAVERLDASEMTADQIIEACVNLPFLAEKKLVVVRSCEQNQQLLEKVELLSTRVPEQVNVYLIGQFDKRKASFKELKKYTELTEFKESNPRDLTAWVVNYTKEQGGAIRRSNAQYLVDRVGAKQQLLAREIEKLLIVEPEISKDTINALTDESVEESIFGLLDDVFAGNTKGALQRYRRQRSNQVDPHYVIAMLTWQLQQLALAVFAPSKDQSTLTAAGMSPYAAGKMLRLAEQTSKSDVRQYVTQLSETDEAIKNGAVDADAAVENFILVISS